MRPPVFLPCRKHTTTSEGHYRILQLGVFEKTADPNPTATNDDKWGRGMRIAPPVPPFSTERAFWHTGDVSPRLSLHVQRHWERNRRRVLLHPSRLFSQYATRGTDSEAPTNHLPPAPLPTPPITVTPHGPPLPPQNAMPCQSACARRLWRRSPPTPCPDREYAAPRQRRRWLTWLYREWCLHVVFLGDNRPLAPLATPTRGTRMDSAPVGTAVLITTSKNKHVIDRWKLIEKYNHHQKPTPRPLNRP